VKRGDLFQRFFLLTVAALFVGCSILLAHFWGFQKRALIAEWQADLEQEIRWLGMHTNEQSVIALANAWTVTHSNARLTAFDEEWKLLADSHHRPYGPELEAGIAALERGDEPAGLIAVAPTRTGGWIVMSRPTPVGVSPALRWEMALAVLGVLLLVAAVIYPFARSMSSIFRKMAAIAGEVAAGNYGRTLDLDRKDELGELAGAFDEMSTRLEEGERLRTRLLHDVSHELRSPLGRIRALAETIERRPERLEEGVEGIADEIELLDRIVGDLLRAARSGAELGAEIEPTALVEWSRQVLTRLAAKVKAQGVAWNVELPQRETEVSIDRQRLTQAISNLIDNSLRALRGIRRPRIDVSVTVENAGWSLAIADNGEGIGAEDLEHVFRRFYRVETHRDRKDGGVGLGLSLVRAIARAHGGDAAIDSELGGGTRVTLRFPAAS